MLLKSRLNTILSLSFLFVGMLACGGIGDKTCGSEPKSSMLKRIINSSDNGEFDRALRDHGAITEEEMPCILAALEGWGATKRRNAARLLPLVGGDRKKVLEAATEVVLETEDLFVWAKLMDTLMSGSKDSDQSGLAAKRHDMIGKALSDDDGFIQSVGLKAGVIGKYPNIDAELKKRLDSMDPKLLAVALDALLREKASKELPRLLKMLSEYETGTKYLESGFKIYVFTPLLNAIIRTEDPNAYLAVRTALEKGYKNAHLVRGTREEFSNFRNTAAVVRPEPAINKFLYYLIKEESIARPAAIDILTTQIEIGKLEANPEIVKVCIETIEKGNLDNTDWRKHRNDKREQLDCEMFFKFLEAGDNSNKGEGKRKLGSDAVEFGRKWLKENE